jgi:xanthine dehydrogenase accessory factor
MSRQEESSVYRALAEAAEAGRECALATILSTRGSTPRKVGSKMLIAPDGEHVGTIGGGCGEGEVIDAALEVIRTGVPTTVRVELTDDILSWSPSVCGGVMRVLVEPVRPCADAADPTTDQAPSPLEDH